MNYRYTTRALNTPDPRSELPAAASRPGVRRVRGGDARAVESIARLGRAVQAPSGAQVRPIETGRPCSPYHLPTGFWRGIRYKIVPPNGGGYVADIDATHFQKTAYNPYPYFAPLDSTVKVKLHNAYHVTVKSF